MEKKVFLKSETDILHAIISGELVKADNDDLRLGYYDGKFKFSACGESDVGTHGGWITLSITALIRQFQGLSWYYEKNLTLEAAVRESEQGVLCWVWDDLRQHKLLRLVDTYDGDPATAYHWRADDWYKNAIPALRVDVESLIFE